MSGTPASSHRGSRCAQVCPARLTFTRTSDKTCATSVVVPSLRVKKELPLNQPVTIEFTPGQAGEIAFACGMNMLHGTLIVR